MDAQSACNSIKPPALPTPNNKRLIHLPFISCRFLRGLALRLLYRPRRYRLCRCRDYDSVEVRNEELATMRHCPRTITTRHYLVGLLTLVSLLVASPVLAGKLHKATEKGNLARVERLIAKGADVNAVDENGLAPLHIAADKGHKAVAELLVAKGANIIAIQVFSQFISSSS